MKYYLLITCFALVACSSLPPAIQDPPAVDISYPQVIGNIGSYKNAPVRWGGTIVEVENEPTFSAIQVLSYPLTSHGHPDTSSAHQGRFVIKSAEFLDPAVYTKNTAITVAGTLEGDTERTIDKKTLRLPLVAAKQVYLWQERDYSNFRGGYPYGGFGYGGYGGYPYGYGGFYGYGPYHPGAFYNYSPYFRGGGYYR
jgi:outer membrane lipoprotein